MFNQPCTGSHGSAFAIRQTEPVNVAERQSKYVTVAGTDERADTRPDAEAVADAFSVAGLTLAARALDSLTVGLSKRLSAGEIAFERPIRHHV